MKPISRHRVRFEALFLLCAAVSVCALTLGGGTRSGFLGDAILQVAAIPLLLISIGRCCFNSHQRFYWRELLLCACVVIVPLIQLIPLPPALWIHLPGREAVVEVFRLTNQEPGWLPLSLTPQATGYAALSLIPPLALFLGVRHLFASQRRKLVIVVLIFTGLSVMLGMAQLAGGPQSPLRFYEDTNTGEAVGFFANRNHFSALLYISLLFTSAWVVDSGLTIAKAKRRDRFETTQVITFIFGVSFVFALGAAQIMARSRAGVALTILALLGIAAIMLIDSRNTSRTRKASLAFLLLAVASVVLFTAQFGLAQLADRFTSVPVNEGRVIFAQSTIQGARSYFPFGSGVGSFPYVYPMFEKPDNIMAATYVNRAHNDFLEAWMESGMLAILVLVVVVCWSLWRCGTVWAATDPRILPIDTLLQRAATIGLMLIALHSLVDYPLRTSAIMCLMAICCALLTRPLVKEKTLTSSRGEAHVRRRRPHSEIDRRDPQSSTAVP